MFLCWPWRWALDRSDSTQDQGDKRCNSCLCCSDKRQHQATYIELTHHLQLHEQQMSAGFTKTFSNGCFPFSVTGCSEALSHRTLASFVMSALMISQTRLRGSKLWTLWWGVVKLVSSTTTFNHKHIMGGLYEMISGDRMCVLYMLIRVISNNGLWLLLCNRTGFMQ